MADLRDPSVVRASYLSQLLDFEGSDLKKVYEPVSNQIGYILSFIVLLMVAHFAWKRYARWRDERTPKFIPYKVLKPPSSMIQDQQARKGEKKKRVCAVVGGTGFIGHHVVDELVKRKEYYVFVLGRKFLPERTNPDADCLIQVDLMDFDGLSNALKGVDSVINAAAVVPNVFLSPDDLYRKNRVAISNLISTAKAAGVKNIIHLSAYPILCKPKEPSFIAFLNSFNAGEKDIIDANGEEGIQTSAICPTNILGLNSPFIDKLVSGEISSFPISDTMPNSFMPVEYLACAIVNAERKLADPSTSKEIAGKKFNLRGERMSWKTLLSLPSWSHKISDISRFLLYVLVKINVVCAALFQRAPFGADMCPAIFEFFNFVEEAVSEEEVQEVYRVLEVGPPHPPINEYIEQMVQRCKAKNTPKAKTE